MENIDVEFNQLIWDAIFPVGSIRKFTNDIDPNVLYGGTWQKLEGVFLFASDASHPLGSTGGEEAHALTADENGEHSHTTLPYAATGGIGSVSDVYVMGGTGAPIWYGLSGKSGKGKPHNNMPPYRAVNVWERIA